MSDTCQYSKPKGGFMFHRSFRDAIRQLPRRQQLALYEAVADYALDGTLPELDNKKAKVFWDLLKPSIDRARKTGLTEPARRGAPTGNRNAAKHKVPEKGVKKPPCPVNPPAISSTGVAAPQRPDKVEYAAALQRLKANPANEAPPLHREIAEISRDQSWIESICILFHLQPTQLTPYFAAFRLECEASDRLRHGSLTDCKQHFKSWLRLQIERKQSNEQSEKRKNVRRRIDVPPASQTDYHSSL